MKLESPTQIAPEKAIITPSLQPTAELLEDRPGSFIVVVKEFVPMDRYMVTGYLRNDQETGRLETVSYGLADHFSKASAQSVADRFNRVGSGRGVR